MDPGAPMIPEVDGNGYCRGVGPPPRQRAQAIQRSKSAFTAGVSRVRV